MTEREDIALELARKIHARCELWARSTHNLSGQQQIDHLAALLRPHVWVCGNRPKIVCLCGSTRFYEQFMRSNYELTMQGIIVLSVGFVMHSAKQAHGEDIGCTAEQKIALDELHKRKIDLADEVLVLNVGGYIGSSTRGEIEHAEKTGKPVRYLEAALPSVPASLSLESSDQK